MKRFALIAAGLLIGTSAAGCATWTDAQLDLTAQAKRGTSLLAEANSRRSTALQQDWVRQRAALDAAFDEDVRTAESLSPKWVMDHRAAYAAGLDALHLRQLNEALAADVDRRNATATLAALDRLAWLLHLQRRAANLQPLEIDDATE